MGVTGFIFLGEPRCGTLMPMFLKSIFEKLTESSYTLMQTKATMDPHIAEQIEMHVLELLQEYMLRLEVDRVMLEATAAKLVEYESIGTAEMERRRKQSMIEIKKDTKRKNNSTEVMLFSLTES